MAMLIVLVTSEHSCLFNCDSILGRDLCPGVLSCLGLHILLVNRTVEECHGDTSTRDNTTEVYLAFSVGSAQKDHLPNVLDMSARRRMSECTCMHTVLLGTRLVDIATSF